MADGESSFNYRAMVFAVAIMFLVPCMASIYTDYDADADDITSELLDDYYSFTGTSAASESVWVLTGIYTPYTGTTSYGYTADGWLYGTIVGDVGSTGYSPSQYSGTSSEYTVIRTDEGVYRYVSDTNSGESADDLYTSVTFDAAAKSSVFFTTSGKVTSGDFFYYEYNGYRYSFQPVEDYTSINEDGEDVAVVANTTSLSLIWYEYYGSSGISGQLILTGSDSGIAYLTAQTIVSAFDSTTSTAKFEMVFNGVSMNIYIKINPYYIAQGYSIEECYNLGAWSIMVSSISTSANSYLTTEYSFNLANIWDTFVDLFTFNYEDYGFSDTVGVIASLVMMVPLYLMLMAIAMTSGVRMVVGLILMSGLLIVQSVFSWLL